ncbi:MAG TPA: metallophosphoesterase family protein [Nannocystaceae bacterium]|nr:metallophosphoesterase family protein [Nannocystaceae bacterium]
MKIAAISDLHIGPRRWMDEFRHAEATFLAFLDRLERTHDLIVLVGDVFQTDHDLFPGRRGAVRQLMGARRRLPALAERFARPPYRYVHGNHDQIARDHLGAAETLRLEADGYCAFFVHGHQYDPIFRRAEVLARSASWFTGRLRAAGLRPVAQWFEANDIRIKHERFHRGDGPYLSAGRRLLREHSADVVVMGHTHVPVRVEAPEGLIVNTGSCSIGQEMYVSIDTRARAVELHAPAVAHSILKT